MSLAAQSLLAEVPDTSSRSKQAIKRVQPKLEKSLKKQGMKFGDPIFIRIFKKEHLLELFVKKSRKFELFKKYPVCYFSGELGPKLRVGDEQSPEGFYYVTPQRMNPYSSFHLSFNIGYPNTYDRSHGRTGSALMVHGNCVSIGCYAMTDPIIEEIYALADAALRNGQSFFRVHIFPFIMTEDNLRDHRESPWLEYWRNLQEGYLSFERTKIPPNVKVRGRRYIFEES